MTDIVETLGLIALFFGLIALLEATLRGAAFALRFSHALRSIDLVREGSGAGGLHIVSAPPRRLV